MYKVDKHLYLSNINSAYDYNLMKQHNIRYAVDCTHDSYDFNLLYKFYKKSDSYKCNIIKYPSYDPHRPDDIKFIKRTIKDILNRLDNYMKGGYNVLIYCHKGQHRSVALCILYLMYKYDIDFITSYKIMKHIYSDIFSHVGRSTIELLQYYSDNRKLLRM